eukprot:g7978.t1
MSASSVRRRSRAGGGRLPAAAAAAAAAATRTTTTAMSMASALASAALSALALALVLPAASAHTGSGKLSLLQPPTVELDPDIDLVVGPTLLFESGQWVTVSWTGIESWMFPDAFVAAFSPGSALDDPEDITEVAPIKYQYLTAQKPFPGDASSEADGESGSGSESEAVEAEAFARGTVGEAAESLRFRLLNLRDAEGYRFGLFKGGVKRPVLVAKTKEEVVFAQPYEVQHVHLALTSKADEMRVSWVTGNASHAPAVKFREIAAPFWQEVAAETSTYGREDLCGPPASTNGFHDPGRLHTAVLSGLAPSRPYEYKAGDSDAQEWGMSSFFYAAPSSPTPLNSNPTPNESAGAAAAAAATARARVSRRLSGLNEIDSAPPKLDEDVAQGVWGSDAVKVAVFGDMGTAEIDGSFDAGHSNEPPSLGTMGILKDHLRGVKVRPGGLGGEAAAGGAVEPQLGLVLHVGDLSYARGFDPQWDEFFEEIEPVASAVPWMVATGNHERDYPSVSVSSARRQVSFYTGTDSGGECGVPTSFRFLMPGAAEKPLDDSPWYSFDFGPIHFTVMSTEHDFSRGSAQYEFIEDDFSSVDRTKTPWLVFAGHRPMYVNSGGAGAGDCEGPAAMEPNCANDQPVAKLMRDTLERLLLEYEVDLAVYGHHHSYQRTCLVANEVCLGVSSRAPNSNEEYRAPVHVILGTAGMGLSKNMVSPRPQWVEYASDREFGLGMIVADSNKLQLSFILDSDSQVSDEMVLAPTAPSPSPSPPSSSRANSAPAALIGLLSFVSLLLLA